ncbi:MAG TPA: tyrosine-type recombinase/integrase, partial [Syntrophobacteraceae bacterium]|nr:tyrosine-type recombinase/integrase [Syntrophobacteraceae bacterium]
EGRVFPFTAELEAVLKGQRQKTDELKRQGTITPYVFHHNGGKPIKEFKRSWKTACRKAGTPGRMFHDFRRTAVRNLERAGVPRSVAMKLTGHKTESVYRRYDIVSQVDLKIAAEKLEEFARTVKVNG